VPSGKTPVLEMPQADWFEGHAALVLALGIIDRASVLSEARAVQIAIRARESREASAQAAVASGGNSGNRSNRR
jgi:hypothetical protein